LSEVTSQRGRPSPMMFVSLGIGAVVAIVLISVVSYFTGGTVTNTQGQSALINTKIAPFSAKDTAGVSIKAPWASGHPTVLVFFASWCTACHSELPAITAYLKQHALGNIQVIGIDSLDNTATGVAFATKSGATFPILEDGGSITQGDFSFQGMPDTVFLSGTGVVKAVQNGVVSTSTFASDLALLR